MVLKILVKYPSTILLTIKTITDLCTNSADIIFNKTSVICNKRCLSSNYVFEKTVTCKIRSTFGKSVNMLSYDELLM